MGTTTKNDVIPIYTKRYVARDRKAKGEVIMQTKKRETQKISHQLAPLLLATTAP